MKTYFINICYLSLLIFILSGCSASDTTKVYTDPFLNSTTVGSVAIFPLRNSAATQTDISLNTGDLIEINKNVSNGICRKKSQHKID